MGLRGASVTLPLKETIMPLLDEVDRNAREIGAVNTIVHRDGRLSGYNTDGHGLVRELEEWFGIRGKTFVVLGAGGAARAALFSLLQAGGTPVVVNRTPERAEALAGRFGCRWVPTAEIGRLQADCLINTTPVGMFPETDRTPLPKWELARFSHVMDIIYNPIETKLAKDAKKAGAKVISGVEMLIYQGAASFEIWTGHKAPVEVMRKAALTKLAGAQS